MKSETEILKQTKRFTPCCNAEVEFSQSEYTVCDMCGNIVDFNELIERKVIIDDSFWENLYNENFEHE